MEGPGICTGTTAEVSVTERAAVGTSVVGTSATALVTVGTEGASVSAAGPPPHATSARDKTVRPDMMKIFFFMYRSLLFYIFSEGLYHPRFSPAIYSEPASNNQLHKYKKRLVLQVIL
jgi:hypothetical protein